MEINTDLSPLFFLSLTVYLLNSKRILFLGLFGFIGIIVIYCSRSSNLNQ